MTASTVRPTAHAPIACLTSRTALPKRQRKGTEMERANYFNLMRTDWVFDGLVELGRLNPLDRGDFAHQRLCEYLARKCATYDDVRIALASMDPRYGAIGPWQQVFCYYCRRMYQVASTKGCRREDCKEHAERIEVFCEQYVVGLGAARENPRDDWIEALAVWDAKPDCFRESRERR